MAQEDGVYQDRDYIPCFEDNASWEGFRGILALCIEEGTPGPFLDIGCGLGFFVECCREFGVPCTGVEGSSFAVQMAKQRDIELVHHNIETVPLPFDAESFGTILLSEVIEHLRKPAAEKLLLECRRLLKKGGAIVILSPSKYNWKVNKDPLHINLYTKESIRTEVEGAGFRFKKYVKDAPRVFLTETRLEYFLMRQVYRFVKAGYLSQSACCVAIKP